MQVTPASAEPLRLHIGGRETRAGWKIFNIQSGPGVDFIGNCADLSQFGDGTVAEIYASHVYEHLGYQTELPAAFKEVFRVLQPGGVFHIGVPDLEILAKLLVIPQLDLKQRFQIMRMMFGGQVDAYDFHKVGLTMDILGYFLVQAGFRQATRVPTFGLFNDASTIQVSGAPISLNVDAVK